MARPSPNEIFGVYFRLVPVGVNQIDDSEVIISIYVEKRHIYAERLEEARNTGHDTLTIAPRTMLVIGLILSMFGIGLFCWLIFTLAV